MTSFEFGLSILASLLACEIYLWLPWAAERLVRYHARKVPKSVRERVIEEWTADLAACAGNLSKVVFAVDLYRAVRQIGKDLLAAYEDDSSEMSQIRDSLVAELNRLQEELLKKERQAMFGRMAAGLVHDLSLPIQNIGNSCKLIVRVFDDPEYRQTFTRTIDHEIDTLRRVLDDLRNVARPAPVKRLPLDVNRSLVDVVESMRGYAEECGIALDAKFSAEPVIIEGDAFALSRVYRNLITNAIQATQAGGRVTVSTALAEDKVQVSVADTGSGIPAERLGAIFDDFVITKKRGLGLGLAITKRIVEQLDGTIAVTSKVGSGSVFTLRFPWRSTKVSG